MLKMQTGNVFVLSSSAKLPNGIAPNNQMKLRQITKLMLENLWDSGEICNFATETQGSELQSSIVNN